MSFMMGGAITILADDATKLAEPVASGWQLILAFLAGIAVIVVLISIVPVYLAHRLTREAGGAVAARGGAVEAEATAAP